MRALVALLALLAGVVMTGSAAAQSDFGGQVRLRWDGLADSGRGPLALAPAGSVDAWRDAVSLLTELRGRWSFITANAALDNLRPDGGPTASRARFNELYASGAALGWQFSAGRKIVGWDVGYGFRPNDVVQAEPRLQLLPGTPQGRALIDAEHFDADTAWSLVAVNPLAHDSDRGDDEKALAARVYRRDGAADVYGFGRWGEHTRGSLGAAIAWVASDRLELHASLRWSAHNDVIAIAPDAGGVQRSDPWSWSRSGAAGQALIGATWTSDRQLSLIGEAWYDGSAASSATWQAWQQRNAALASSAAPAAAIAGNLGWQTQAFSAMSLRRQNLFLRAAWTHDAWQPAIDLLYQPEDAGRAITASLNWQGDRVAIDLGLRQYGGPASAVLAQLPQRRVAYLAGTWTF